MSIATIKKKNREFAKWWDRWLLRIQHIPVKRQSKSDKDPHQNSSKGPEALELFKRLPFEGNR